ncbi:MAG TPA: hypothetical protein VMF89_28515 [Polyangiales bacterium]|nr:hypothetical protein [Polyangiales bacterium]
MLLSSASLWVALKDDVANARVRAAVFDCTVRRLVAGLQVLVMSLLFIRDCYWLSD